MEFNVQKDVLDSGVIIVFATIENMDNHGVNDEWQSYRTSRIEELYNDYKDIDVHADPVLEGFNILHDNVGVKRRKNIPASENLIKLLVKHHDMFYINRAVDIYNIISLESKLALGAHNMTRQTATSLCVLRTVRKNIFRSVSRNLSLSCLMNIAIVTIQTKSFADWRYVR